MSDKKLESIQPAPDMAEYTGIDSSIAFAEAEQNGWKIVVPAPNELQIDIDSASQYDKHNHALEAFLRFFQIGGVESHGSKSGAPGKLHITITLMNEVSPLERIALQSLLGSDPRRELLSYVRLKLNDPVPTLFMEKK